MQKLTTGTYSGDVVPFDVARISRDDEISLVDLWLTIRRRWLWLVAGLLAGVLAAIAYATLTTPIYESRASIQIGKVHNLGLIEDIGVLETQLVDQHGPVSVEGVRRGMPRLKEATRAPGRNNILELTAVGYSPEEARDFLKQVVAGLIQRHERIYGDGVGPLRQRLADIDGEIGVLTAQVAELGKIVARLTESYPAQASLAAIERGRLYTELNHLERDRTTLQQQTMKLSSSPSEVIVGAALPTRPVSPRSLIAITIGIVFGLALGLLAAFLREFFANAQTHTRPDTRSNIRAHG